MTNPATYTDGNLVIDMGALCEGMDADALMDLAQHIGCEDGVIRAVCDQLLNGYTEDGSYGYQATLDEQRQRLSDGVDDARRQIVKNLLWEKSCAEASLRQHRKWAYAMFRAWPESRLGSRPKLPEYDSDSPEYPTAADAEAVLEEKA